MYSHNPKFVFAIARSEFFFLLYSFPFSQPFLVLSGCLKKLLSLEILISYSVTGHFTTIFAPKLILFFSLLRQNAVDIQNRLLC